MFQNSRFAIIPVINICLIDRFVRIPIDYLLLLLNRNTSHCFFSRVSIVPIPLDLLGKQIGIHRQFHPPITGHNKYQYSIHQLVDRPTGVFTRLLYRALYLLVKAIDIDRQFHIPIGQTIGIDRQFHVPIGHSKRYRLTVGHTYCKNNSLLCRFIRTYWSKK